MLGFMPCDEQEKPSVPNCNPISRWRASRSEPECDEKCFFFLPERYSEYIYDVIFKPPHQKSITKSLLLLRESHTSSQKPRNRTSQPEICFLRTSTANVVEVVVVVIIILIIQIMLQLQFLSFEGNLQENVGVSNEGVPNIKVVGIDQIGLIPNNENNTPTIAVVDDVNPHQGISD